MAGIRRPSAGPSRWAWLALGGLGLALQRWLWARQGGVALEEPVRGLVPAGARPGG